MKSGAGWLPAGETFCGTLKNLHITALTGLKMARFGFSFLSSGLLSHELDRRALKVPK
jgi:hypothetical protein